MTPRKVTITQVAQAAGVSIASASRALNGLTASAETSQRVHQAAQDLGYVADARAQSLKTGNTMTLGYFVADIGNPVYVEMMAAIEAVTADAGYRLMVTATGGAEDAVELIRGLDRGFVDGVVLSPLRVTDELVRAVDECSVPITVLGRMPEDIDVDCVRPDSARGVQLAVDHLVARGRRRVTFLNGPTDTTPGEIRLAAFHAAADRHPHVGRAVVQAEDFTMAAGLEATRDLFSRPLPTDAVIAANDLLAVGAMHGAAEQGVGVPQDVAVVGMDDTDLAAMFRPGLTSVNLGASRRGRLAAELLLERLQDPSVPTSRSVIAPSLSVRASTLGDKAGA